ncbi:MULTISPECIES: hypothetical protein [Streptomyces]|uniref:hypothetical protein n=1 Tax=Streptomyces TaxID=1883 RepID=UPI000AB837EC|nr:MULTISPECIES: hypothetical protein [Streptomyces]
MRFTFMSSPRHPQKRIYPLVSAMTARKIESGTGTGTFVIQKESELGPAYERAVGPMI